MFAPMRAPAVDTRLRRQMCLPSLTVLLPDHETGLISLTASLPNELWEKIFDHLHAGVSSIVRASHVCKRWRRLALQHPKFCSDIYITDTNARDSRIPKDDIGWYIERLAAQLASSEQPLNVTIRLGEWNTELVDAALPLLAPHMHRVASFIFVSYRGHTWQQVLAMLEAPTPLLESLRIDANDHPRVEHSHVEEMILPESFLRGKERLRSLALRLFTLPYEATPCASIEQLGLRMRGELTQIDDALDACPNVRRLDLSFRLGTLLRDAEEVARNARVAQLPAVSIVVNYGALPYYAAVLETHFPSRPLHITEFFVRPDRGAADITLCDPATQRQRILLGSMLDSQDSEDVAGFRALGIADRLVELRACKNAIDTVAALFPSLPVLEVFTVALSHTATGTPLHPEPRAICHSFDDDCTYRARIACPALATVVIEGEGQTCSTAWLAHFVGHALGVTSRGQLELRLKGASLSGDPQEIWGYFHSISIHPNA